MGLLDVLGALKSKEVAALVDKAGRYWLYGCVAIGTSFVVGIAIFSGATTFEVGIGSIGAISAALLGIEKLGTSKKKEA